MKNREGDAGVKPAITVSESSNGKASSEFRKLSCDRFRANGTRVRTSKPNGKGPPPAINRLLLKSSPVDALIGIANAVLAQIIKKWTLSITYFS